MPARVRDPTLLSLSAVCSVRISVGTRHGRLREPRNAALLFGTYIGVGTPGTRTRICSCGPVLEVFEDFLNG